LSEEPETPAAAAKVVARRLPQAIVAVSLGFLILVAGLLAAGRFGVLLPQARLLIEARTDGLKLGSLGRLKIEGLSGDVWRDFGVRRLTLRDEKGVWLEATNLRLHWRYHQLLFRRFHADSIAAENIRLYRRPTMGPKGKDEGLPVSFFIDDAHGRVEMLPGFAGGQRGVYDLKLYLAVQRRGGMRGTVRADSHLNTGDHLNVRFELHKKKPMLLQADVVEANGGAIAGALGLPAKQPFLLRIDAGGPTSHGRFTALAVSGARRPLEASGAWNPLGGEVSGHAWLDVSSLTAPWAQRVGREVRFSISGRKAWKDLYALDLQADAENLAIHAEGQGDIGTRLIGPKGINLTASTPALSRLVGGGPQLGPGRLAGVYTQAGERSRFAGTMAVSRVALGDYALDQASGPVELVRDPHGINIKAGLTAHGGRGAGFVAALLGGAPRASFEGSRLADGRLTLRRLDVAGSGLKVEASGGRSLLGGLNFDGRASVSNLAAARIGASGGARFDWSASQAGVSQPWNFSLDGAGEKFATGFAELDRLLGPSPKLDIQAALQGRRLSVAVAKLDGAALKASSAGVMSETGALTFKLDWSARGPFRAGPVEITGAAKGNGAITGTLGAPRADLMADIEAIDLPKLPLKQAHITLSFLRKPDGSSGMIAATASSGYGPARGRADFAFPKEGVDLSGLSVDAGGLKADGSVSLRRSAPSAADLTVAVGRGAFLEAGRVAGQVKIVDASGGPRATLDLSADGARTPGSTVTLSAAHLTAHGPLSRLPYVLDAKGVAGAGPFSAAGRGVFATVQPGYEATFEGSGRLGGRDLRTLEPAAFRFGGPERSARVRLASGDGGRISLDGRLTDAATEIRAQLAGVGLNLVDEDLTGKVDGDLTLQGRGSRLDGGFEARLAGARGRGAPEASGVNSVVKGRLAGATLSLDATATNGQGLRAEANIDLPVETSAAPFRVAIARQQPMKGRFMADGEVRPLWDLLIGGERSLAGRVQAQGTLGGTLADPQAVGRVAVSGGRFDDGGTGLSLRDVVIAANFNRDAVDVTQASGVDGHGGSLSGSGRISLVGQGLSSFRLDLQRFRVIDNEQATASATGQATMARDAAGKVKLSGKLVIDRADISPDLPVGTGVVKMDVIEKNRPPELVAAERASAPRLAAAASGGVALDVDLDAPGRVYLRGRGLNVELALDAHVGGTTSAPMLTGNARVVRGDYDFAGKRFEFDPESIVYLSTRPRDIRLNLTAQRDDPTLTAVVRITGTAAQPEITLSSTPSLPSDEVLSQVLFGASASQLSPLEAAQLAAAVSALASGGGLDVIGNLRAFAGLDRLALAGGDAAGVTVSGGKYITDKVYLELTGGGREGPTAQVEWRVRRQLSILSRLGGQAGARLAVRWRRDY